jgi:uncharacterized membrane protein YedE/YeeE
MVLFEAARLFGLLSVHPFPLLYAPTAANVIGGFLFGIGMVLAGGCVVGTLYKMGAGSALSMTAFFGLIVGSGVYAEFHPAWASFIKATTLFPGKITVAQILGVDQLVTVLAVVLPASVILLSWKRRNAFVRVSYATGYLQPAKAAIALALIGAVSYVLVGMPMGVTSTFTKIAGLAERALLPEHYQALTMYAAMPLKFVHSLTGPAPLTGGPGPAYDALAAVQVPLIIGIVAGSALSAALLRELRVSFRVPGRQYAMAACGGLLMGLASRMAPTCNVWHLLGGLPILAASSILFLIGMLGGAWTGGKLLLRILGMNGAAAGGGVCVPHKEAS